MSETTNIFNSNTTTNTSNSIYTGHEDSYETSTWVDKSIVILVWILTIISILCSAGIVVECYMDYRLKKDTTVKHILFWMHLNSIPLLIGSGSWEFATPNEINTAWLAIGNTASCTAMGFIKQFFGCAVVCFDIALSIVCLLTVRYNVTSFSMKKLEKWFHIVIWPYTILISVVPILDDGYNFSGVGGCWLGPAPLDCTDDCLRGNNTDLFIALTTLTVLLQLLVGIGVMVRIYIHVRRLENRNGRWAGASVEIHGTYNSGSASALNYTPSSMALNSTPTETAVQRSLKTLHRTLRRQSSTTTLHARSHAVAVQGLLYVSTAILTYGAIFIVGVVDETVDEMPITIHYAVEIPFAMHGIFYWFIFARNRDSMRTKYGMWLQKILQGKWCCPERVSKPEKGANGSNAVRNQKRQTHQVGGPSATAEDTTTSLGQNVTSHQEKDIDPSAMAEDVTTPLGQNATEKDIDDASTKSSPESFELEHDSKLSTTRSNDEDITITTANADTGDLNGNDNAENLVQSENA